MTGRVAAPWSGDADTLVPCPPDPQARSPGPDDPDHADESHAADPRRSACTPPTSTCPPARGDPRGLPRPARAGAAAIDPAFGAAAGDLSEFVLGGGKRIRPTFAWWGWRGAGGDPDGPAVDAVLRAVSALELIQACALVHDDLMDASATRRGRPTVHVAFARRHAEPAWRGRPARFGAAAAILLGDLALAWADDMLRGAGLDADAAARAAAPWEAMRTEVLGGQYLDVFVQSTGDSSARAALRIDRYKTAAYTVERPLHLGAAIAGRIPDLSWPATAASARTSASRSSCATTCSACSATPR